MDAMVVLVNDHHRLSVVQIAALLQLAWPASLQLARSGAAAGKGRSRVLHFAMPFASTVVNVANADHAPRCMCVAPHGCVLCTWLCGIHCVPRRGATALLGMQHGTGAHGSGSSNGCSGVGAAGNALRSLVRLWLSRLSGTSLGLAPDPVRHHLLYLTHACACALLALWGCMLGWTVTHVSAV